MFGGSSRIGHGSFLNGNFVHECRQLFETARNQDMEVHYQEVEALRNEHRKLQQTTCTNAASFIKRICSRVPTGCLDFSCSFPIPQLPILVRLRMQARPALPRPP